MSANPVARPQSRRTILAGLSSLPAIGAVAAVAAEPDPAEVAFGRWLDFTFYYNRHEFADLSEAAMKPVADRHEAYERAVRDLPPTIPAAAAVLMVELSYAIDRPDKAITLGSFSPGDEPHTLILILRCLRPMLTGRLAAVAADLLDNPDLLLPRLLLTRSIGWRACEEIA